MSSPTPPLPPASPDDLIPLLHDWKCGRPEARTRIVQTLQAVFLRVAGVLLQRHKSDTLDTDRAPVFAALSLTLRSVWRERAGTGPRGALARERHA
ncbi:MAG: hypothetical protein ACOVQT_11780 [Rubrivivax sp.]